MIKDDIEGHKTMVRFKVHTDRFCAPQRWIGAFVLAASLSMSSQAFAAFQGKLWIIAGNTNADFSAVPATPPDVTFTTKNINFIGVGPMDGQPKVSLDFQVDSFLKSTHTTSNIVYSGQPNAFLPGRRPVVATTPVSNGLGGGPLGSYETLIELTGKAILHNGDTIVATHDDGVTIKIDGSIVNGNSGPSFPQSDHFEWTGTTAAHTIDIVYVEEGGGPAQLVFSPAAQIP